MNKILYYLTVSAFVTALISCGGDSEPASDSSTKEPLVLYATRNTEIDPIKNIGVGPITSVDLAEIDQALVDEGKLIYDEKCTACHMTTQRLIGPAPAGILDRRSPEWIMNMILNPEQMVKEDPIAKELLKEFMVPMAGQGLTEEEARKILEYFRTI